MTESVVPSSQLEFARNEERQARRHMRASSWVLTVVVVTTLILNSIMLNNMTGNSTLATVQRAKQLQVAQCTQQQLGQALHYRATATTLPPSECLPVKVAP